MKGIKKLFLGLVFMTLIGVAFKVEAKAAEVQQLEFEVPGGETQDWSGDVSLQTKVSLKVPDSFPDIGTPAGNNYAIHRHVYTITDENGRPLKTVNVYLMTVNTGGGAPEYYYAIDKSNAYSITSQQKVYLDGLALSKSEIYKTQNMMSSHKDKIQLSVEAEEEIDCDYSGLSNDVFSKLGGAQVKLTDVPKTKTPDPVIVQEYEVKGEVTGYTTNVKIEGESPYDFSYYLLPGDKVSSTAIVTVPTTKVESGKNQLVKVKEWKGTSGITINSPKDSAERVSYEVEMPTESPAAQTLTVDVNQTAVKISGLPASVSAKSSQTVTFDSYNAEDLANSKVKFGDDSIVVTWTGNSGTFTVPETSGTKEVSFAMPDGNVVYTSVTVDGSSEYTVGVSAANSICTNIYTLLSRYNKTSSNVTANSKDTNYIKVDPANTSALPSAIKIYGVKKTDSQPYLSVDGKDVKVTVYDSPKISVDKSSTSSTVVITMPKNVRHEVPNSTDEIHYRDIEETTIKFVGEKGEKKKDYSLKDQKVTFKMTDLISIFNDVCKGDHDTVKIYAYPADPASDYYDDYYYDKKEISVYRISLDDSEHAKYTINGNDVSDHFYAIEDAEYEIKAKAADTNEYKFKKWDNDDFNSEGGGKFTATKARTFKAIYEKKNSSTTSSSLTTSSSSTTKKTAVNGEGTGTGGDGYDDVPKTGESMADIWILWTVLFISILGAGFMIWKRFGIARAIAAADQEAAYAEQFERAEAEKKEKKEKLDMLKDLRNL